MQSSPFPPERLIALKRDTSLNDLDLKQAISTAWHQARQAAQERANLIRVVGWAGAATTLITRLREALKEIQTNDRLRSEHVTVKILAFHGGTWFGTYATPGVLSKLVDE